MKAFFQLAPTIQQALGAVATWALLSALGGGGLIAGVLLVASWRSGPPLDSGVLLIGAGAGGFLAAQIGLLVRYLISYHTARRGQPADPGASSAPAALLDVTMVLILLSCLLYWLVR